MMSTSLLADYHSYHTLSGSIKAPQQACKQADYTPPADHSLSPLSPAPYNYWTSLVDCFGFRSLCFVLQFFILLPVLRRLCVVITAPRRLIEYSRQQVPSMHCQDVADAASSLTASQYQSNAYLDHSLLRFVLCCRQTYSLLMRDGLWWTAVAVLPDDEFA